MISNSSPIAWILSVLLITLAACGSSAPVTVNYHDRSDITTYQSRSVNTGHTFSTSNYGSARTLELQATAECNGAECKPDRVRIAFLVTGGGSPIRFPDRTLRITTDNEEHEHTQAFRRDAQETSTVGRHLLSIDVDFDDFVDFAQSETFDVVLGSQNFSVDYDRRATFRALVDATDGIFPEDETTE